MFKRILIGVDGEAPSVRAVTVGSEMAAQFGAELMIVHTVWPTASFGPADRMRSAEVFEARYKSGEQLVADMQRLVPANLTSQTRVLLGQPAQEIVWCARNWRADLVVVGDHNRHAVTRFFFGSTTDAVLRHAPCPVLVIREIDRSSPIRDTTAREAEPAMAAVSRAQ